MIVRAPLLMLITLLAACGAPASSAKATASTAPERTGSGASERAVRDASSTGILSAAREAARELPAGVPRDGVEYPELFAERRAEFLRRLAKGVAVFHAKPVYERNHDVEYPYRQDSDFYYLTGFEEPEAVAVLSAPSEGNPSYVLFVPPRDPEQEIWTGHRWGADAAREVFKADAAYVLDSLSTAMTRLLEGSSRVLYSSGGDLEFGTRLAGWVPEAARRASGRDGKTAAGGDASEEPPGGAGFASPLPIVHEMRLIHSPEEIARIQRAIDITELAQRASMRAATAGLPEYDLEALQYYLYRTHGSERYAFPSIVGSGPNSVTLHYGENNRRIEKGDVIVMDIGAEYAMYAADVTRTVPASGRFSPEQREIYQIVADAQDAAFQLMRPGRTIADAHAAAVRVVTGGLIRLGLLRGSVDENIRSQAYQRFFMHGTSHWIGLDVHDPAEYQEPDGSPRVFRPGMILSNEPGIYIREGTPGVDRKWFNIGVRLENDVLITEGDPVDMTAKIPRSIADVEAEMAKPPLTLETGKPAPALGGEEAARQDGAMQERTGTSEVTEGGRIVPPGQGKKKEPKDP